MMLYTVENVENILEKSASVFSCGLSQKKHFLCFLNGISSKGGVTNPSVSVSLCTRTVYALLYIVLKIKNFLFVSQSINNKLQTFFS